MRYQCGWNISLVIIIIIIIIIVWYFCRMTGFQLNCTDLVLVIDQLNAQIIAPDGHPHSVMIPDAV